MHDWISSHTPDEVSSIWRPRWGRMRLGNPATLAQLMPDGREGPILKHGCDQGSTEDLSQQHMTMGIHEEQAACIRSCQGIHCAMGWGMGQAGRSLHWLSPLL